MSLKATLWAYGLTGIMPEEKLVMIYLADYMGDEIDSDNNGIEIDSFDLEWVCMEKNSLIKAINSLHDKKLVYYDDRWVIGCYTTKYWDYIDSIDGDQIFIRW